MAVTTRSKAGKKVQSPIAAAAPAKKAAPKRKATPKTKSKATKTGVVKKRPAKKAIKAGKKTKKDAVEDEPKEVDRSPRSPYPSFYPGYEYYQTVNIKDSYFPTAQEIYEAIPLEGMSAEDLFDHFRPRLGVGSSGIKMFWNIVDTVAKVKQYHGPKPNKVYRLKNPTDTGAAEAAANRRAFYKKGGLFSPANLTASPSRPTNTPTSGMFGNIGSFIAPKKSPIGTKDNRWDQKQGIKFQKGLVDRTSEYTPAYLDGPYPNWYRPMQLSTGEGISMSKEAHSPAYTPAGYGADVDTPLVSKYPGRPDVDLSRLHSLLRSQKVGEAPSKDLKREVKRVKQALARMEEVWDRAGVNKKYNGKMKKHARFA